MGLRIEGSGETKNNNDTKALVAKLEKEIASEALAKNISGDKTNLSSVDDVSIASVKNKLQSKILIQV